MAWARSAADVDRRSNNPRQDIKARQSLPARPVRAGGVGRADQAEELGAPWAQALDRGGQNGCITTSLRLRSPTNWRASRGAFLLAAVPSRRGRSPTSLP